MIKLKEDEDEKVKIVEVATHPHKLIFRPVGYDNIRWHCDSITMGLACGRGHFKGVFEERDHPRYECRDCNFDLCDLCMLAQQKQQGQDSKEQIKETQEIFKNPMEIQKEMQITMKNKLKEEKKEQINPLNQQKDILFAWVKQEEQKVNELEQKLLEEQNSKEQKELEHLNNIPFQSPNQDFQYLKILSSTNQIWIDPEFPHCLGSITKDQQNKAIFSSVQWKLPIEFFPKNLQKIQVFDKVEANDIIQGSYDISYMLSLLAAIAEYPERLIRVFNSRQYQEKGVYSVTLFNLGFPEEVVIDSYFPVDANQNELIFAKPNGKELWVLILEKAWAKFLGAYTNCEEIPAKIIMNHLLGIPSQSFWIKDFSTHELKMNLFSYQEQQFIMVAASKPECKEEDGLLPEYSYSILNIFQGDNLFLIKLRNPQGNLEFCGDYGYNSKKWTDPLIQKTGFNRKNDDGIFFLTIEEFEKYFHHLTIGMFKQNYSLSTIASDKSSKSSYFKIVNSKDQEVSIVLNQSLQNQVKSRNQLQFYPASICLLDSDGKTISYGNESECNYGGQTISIFSEQITWLKQGTYLLKAKLRNSESNDFSVSLYSTKDCTIEKENKSEYVKLEQKRFRILGEERTRCKVQPKNLGGQTHFYQVWLPNSELFIFAENKSKKTIVDAIFTLEEMENIKIKKHNRKDLNQIELRCMPKSSEYAFLKKIDPTKTIKLSWKIQKIYEIV
eukprot:TRINITY_DN2969_c0_g1_i2.p1 TRINITY_DN2969_c0_g1~~TRINITY_DN2969_c0_g1_i2.p1  ORF type:complete len:725 (-),score=139.38 TRINITY_DN2969_c0_g1_i2:100-2274(-)